MLTGKLAQRKKNFYKCVVSTSPAYAWQYLCPTCTNDLTSRRVLSPMDVQVSPASADPSTNVDVAHVSKDEFVSKIVSLTSVITDIASQIKEIKSSLDIKTTSYADIAKKNIEMSNTMTRTIKETVKSVVNETDPTKVLIFSRLPETGSVVSDYCLITEFIDGLVPEGGVTFDDNDVCDIVRLGRPRDDLKRLIKVTFTNVRSVRLIMEYYHNHAKDRFIPESANVLFQKSITEENRMYTKFGIRPDLSKEKRDVMKERAQKVYCWNNEIRDEALAKGSVPEVSYSLRGNGNIWKFTKIREIHQDPRNSPSLQKSPELSLFEKFRLQVEQKECGVRSDMPNDKWIRDKDWNYIDH